MPSPGVGTAGDYTRGGRAPGAGDAPDKAAAAPTDAPPEASPGRDRAEARRVRRWGLIQRLALAGLFALLLPLDGPISRALRSVRLSGDLRREIESLQQYGQTASTLIIVLAIWLQDPHHRRRLADFAGAYVLTAALVMVGKGLIGRPRPKYDDPLWFLGPLGEYPVDRVTGSGPVGPRHAWEFWSGISSDLWSMPSSHTAYAAAIGLFVATLYPRLRWLMFALVALVGVARVLTGAHYPTDVLVGAAIGLGATAAAVRGRWGQRVLEAVANRRRPA
jgi:membrane-associated phospholipid phosphatase